ncbi:trans-sialidase [Trypanosoma cruzi]|nr:trans-sialidase [Trypanosoma cruzi]
MDKDPLPRVALWAIARCALCVGCGVWPYPVGRGIELEVVTVCLFSSSIGVWLLAVCAFVVWRAESSHPRTDGTAMVCVSERAGVESPDGMRAVAVLFPPVFCFFRVFFAASCFFPCHPLFCVPAWSGRMLTGHVDCECLLTASIHLPLSLSVFPCWVWRVAPREGWPAHTDGPP